MSNALPRGLLVALVLVAGLILIILFNPPKTVCDSQIEVLRKSQTEFLFPEKKQKYVARPGIEKATEVCKYGNSPGGCLDLFTGLRKLTRDLDAVPSNCADVATDIAEIRSAIWDSLRLVVRLAWGEKAPASFYEKQGWLDSFHMSIYCDMKRLTILLYGNELWTEFREDMLKTLPQAPQIGRSEAWQRSILSYPCTDTPQ